MAKKRRQGMSVRLHNLFYDPTAKGFYVVNDILAVTTIISIVAIVLETVQSLNTYSYLFLLIEYVSVSIFTLEYIARIIANKKKIRAYTLSFFGIIDLLAILPSFIGFGNFTFIKTVRVLRILRMLRMVRLAKLAKRPKHTDVEEDKSVFRLSLEIYFATLLSAVLLSGTLLYIFEEGMFRSIPDGMLWALRATLRIPPTTMPQTLLGESIVVLTYFFGLLLFGLLISVMGTLLKTLLLGKEK